eukprot:jgi/Bigna1/67637/fgenesh1_pg.4_\
MSSTFVVIEHPIMEDPVHNFNGTELSSSSTEATKNIQAARKQEYKDVETKSEEDYSCLTDFFREIKMMYPFFIFQILCSLSITLPLPCLLRRLQQHMPETTPKIEAKTTEGIMKEKTDDDERIEAVKLDEEYFSSSNLGIEA